MWTRTATRELEAATASARDAEQARAAAVEGGAAELEAAGASIEGLMKERDEAKGREKALTEQIEALITRQARLAEEMGAQDEALQRLLSGGAVDRAQVGATLVSYFKERDAKRKEEILTVLARLLELERDQYIEIGLVSRWEHLQPEITASMEAGEAGLSDAFATFLAAER